MTEGTSRKRVVYLLGAGASHACVKAVGSPHGILMRDLGQSLADKVNDMVTKNYQEDSALTALANEVINDDTDIEHVITFLDESASALHRRFADDLRKAFESALREKLDVIEKTEGRAPTDLYRALLDMYEVDGFPEELAGILTINYDEYIEEAVETVYGQPVDFGVHVQGANSAEPGLNTVHSAGRTLGLFHKAGVIRRYGYRRAYRKRRSGTRLTSSGASHASCSIATCYGS